jgi:integrase/recombinase XerD
MGVFQDKMSMTLKIKGYAMDTQRNYLYQMKQFVKFHNLPPDKLRLEDIYAYQLYLIEEKKVSWTTFNITVAAIKFFYNKTMGCEWAIKQIPYQKKEKNYQLFPANLKLPL